MKTLVIPCGGNSINGERPRYIHIHPDGKLMIEKCIEGVANQKYDRIVIAVLQEHIQKFEVDRTILIALMKKYPIEIIELVKDTSGPAETVYRAIKGANITGEIHIKDVDNYLEVEACNNANFIAGLDLTKHKRDIHDLRKKSFVILNEQKQVLDIVEKKFRSDIICVGLYGFRSAEDIIFAYERLVDKNYKISKLYLSHLIAYLVGYSNKVFHYIPVIAYESWGSTKEFSEIQKAYTTYFLDFDKVNVRDERVINILHKLNKNGARFVGLTTSSRGNLAIEEWFEQNHINYIGAIYNCSHSGIRVIIDDYEKLILNASEFL